MDRWYDMVSSRSANSISSAFSPAGRRRIR
jgi:hypothetical protein